MAIYTRYPNSAKPDKDRSTAPTIAAIALLYMAVALHSGSAIGQSQMVAFLSGRAIGQPPISQDRLVGTWTYESVVVERTDGTRVAPFGPDPKGFITLFADGRYSLQLFRADIPTIASKDRLSGTAEENRAVAQGVLSQFGTYSVNEAEGTLTLHVETSSFPNENGTNHEPSPPFRPTNCNGPTLLRRLRALRIRHSDERQPQPSDRNERPRIEVHARTLVRVQ
jgi:hypothetical protein